MAEIDEIVQTVERLQGVLEDLASRGLRSAGGEQLGALEMLREEFERIGAGHLANRVAVLSSAIRAGDRNAAAALLRAQASVRVFERVLTLETAAAALQGLLEQRGGEP
jgi:hypothetical protein